MTEMVDCQAVRGYLRNNPESLEPGLRAVCERHAAGCAECREYLALDPVLLRAYDRIRIQRAPDALREEVLATLRSEKEGPDEGAPSGVTPIGRPAVAQRRAPRWIGWRVAATLAAASVVAVALSIGPEDSAPGDLAPVEDAYVEEFLRYASAGEHLATKDPAEVSAFFRSRLDIPVVPIVAEGLELEGAEVCILEGQMGALILYKLDGAVVSHYLIPRDDATPRPATPQPLQHPARPEWGSQASMVTWASPQVEQALVGSIQVSDMVHLASRGIS